MDSLIDLAQPMPRPTGKGLDPEFDPFNQNLRQRLLLRPAITPDHDQIDRHARFERGLGEEHVEQLRRRDARTAWLENQPDRGFATRLIAHGLEHTEHGLLELQLLGRQGLLAKANLGVGQLLDLLEHFGGRHAMGQFSDHQLPLAASELFNRMPRPNLDRPAPGGIDLAQFGWGGDHLPATRKIGARHDREQIVDARIALARHHDRGLGDLAQIVRRDFGGHADRNARGAVEQHHRQARRQERRLFGRSVVIGHEINRALVDFIEQ